MELSDSVHKILGNLVNHYWSPVSLEALVVESYKGRNRTVCISIRMEFNSLVLDNASVSSPNNSLSVGI